MSTVDNIPAGDTPIVDSGWTLEQRSDRLSIELEPNEGWWGGAVSDGGSMPFGAVSHSRNLAEPAGPDGGDANQSSPFLVSSSGRTVWSDKPFTFTFDGERLTVEGRGIELGRAGSTLAEGYRAGSGRYFAASGRPPAREIFAAPELCTWIEQPHLPTQDAVLRQVREAIDAGIAPGVLIIDDNWARDYGDWSFDGGRFPDPAAMVDELHSLGCRLMLWVVPFVSPDSLQFRRLEKAGLLVRDASGEPAIRKWWNGYSAMLDLSNPVAVSWYTDGLDRLITETGVDGFKFDAGDITDYRPTDRSAGGFEPVDFSEAWAQIAERYPFNELRACWRMGGRPLVQRLQDKPPSWGPDGLRSLVPELIAQGLIGHAFTCPDLIGGGEIEAVTQADAVDQEFFVRYAQIAALSPIMQFSVSPHRVLDADHQAAVLEAVAIREATIPLLSSLVDHAALTGEPVVRHMAYHAPGLESVNDQFFLGADLIVAPVADQGARTREVVLPEGHWRGDDGTEFIGPAKVTVEVTLARLPRFERVAALA